MKTTPHESTWGRACREPAEEHGRVGTNLVHSHLGVWKFFIEHHLWNPSVVTVGFLQQQSDGRYPQQMNFQGFALHLLFLPVWETQRLFGFGVDRSSISVSDCRFAAGLAILPSKRNCYDLLPYVFPEICINMHKSYEVSSPFNTLFPPRLDPTTDPGLISCHATCNLQASPQCNLQAAKY